MKCPQCGHQTYRARGGKDICPQCGYRASLSVSSSTGTASGEEKRDLASERAKAVPLICSQCGGKLSVEREQISMAADIASILPGQKIECPYCGTEFLSEDQVGQVAGETINIVGSGVVVGDGSSSTVTIVTTGRDKKHSPADSQAD
jgi:transcription elongation factor Elf1